MSLELTQHEADKLIAMEKHYFGDESFSLPLHGGRLEIPVYSADKCEKFLLDVSRGTVSLHRKTYQKRVRTTIQLIRIDFGGSAHRNPDGEEMQCPHIHVYRAGYGDKWAFPLPKEFDANATMHDFFQSFMDYCRVIQKPQIDRELFQ